MKIPLLVPVACMLFLVFSQAGCAQTPQRIAEPSASFTSAPEPTPAAVPAAEPAEDKIVFEPTLQEQISEPQDEPAELPLPQDEPQAPPTEKQIAYIVEPGDTLSGIAERFGIAPENIIRWNPQIENPSLIYAGQKVCVAAKCAPPPSTPKNLPPAPPAEPHPSPPAITALDVFFANLPQECSGAYINFATGEAFSVRANRPQYSASLYKLTLLLGVEQARAEGRLDLNTVMPSGRTVYTDLHLAITQSHNPAAEELGSYLGWNWLTQVARNADMVNTDHSVIPARTSAGDILLFFTRVYRGELLSADLTNILFAEPQARLWLGQLLPASWDAATKYGYLPRGYISGIPTVTVNDAVLVRWPEQFSGVILCTGYQEGLYVKLINDFASILRK